MRKKNYKGAKCTKRYVEKCEDVCKTYDAIQYAYADLLSKAEDVQSFRVNVLLEGLQEGANLISVDKNTLIYTLLPRTEGRFTRFGLRVNRIELIIWVLWRGM